MQQNYVRGFVEAKVYSKSRLSRGRCVVEVKVSSRSKYDEGRHLGAVELQPQSEWSRGISPVESICMAVAAISHPCVVCVRMNFIARPTSISALSSEGCRGGKSKEEKC